MFITLLPGIQVLGKKSLSYAEKNQSQLKCPTIGNKINYTTTAY